MFELKGLDHIVLRTNIRKKLLEFYRDILGCTIVKEQPKCRLTQLRAGRSMIDIIEVDCYLPDHENNAEYDIKVAYPTREECAYYANEECKALFKTLSW